MSVECAQLETDDWLVVTVAPNQCSVQLRVEHVSRIQDCEGRMVIPRLRRSMLRFLFSDREIQVTSVGTGLDCDEEQAVEGM